jgi:hypothetical protein
MVRQRQAPGKCQRCCPAHRPTGKRFDPRRRHRCHAGAALLLKTSQDQDVGPLDSIAGYGFHLLVTDALLPELARGEMAAALRAAGVTVIGLASQSGVEGTVVDVDGTYQQWFAEQGWNAVAVRPDFYVYGTAVDVTSARALAGELVSALCVETAMAERLARSR